MFRSCRYQHVGLLWYFLLIYFSLYLTTCILDRQDFVCALHRQDATQNVLLQNEFLQGLHKKHLHFIEKLFKDY